MYTMQFEGISPNIKPKHVVWTPKGMTQEQALQQLPVACHRHLTVQPCAEMVSIMTCLYTRSMENNDVAAAELIQRCIVAANCIRVAADV
jgi:hypothetical protein